MKKINVKKLWQLLKPVALAALMVGVGIGLAYAGSNVIDDYYGNGSGEKGICGLLLQLRTVFRILRILCFAGAAFVIMGWAWSYITTPDVKIDEAKKKGIALIVAFILLFGVGVFLTYLPNIAAGVCTNVVAVDW